MSYVISGDRKKTAIAAPSCDLFQIKIDNESAVKMEVDFPFWHLRDLSKARFGFFWMAETEVNSIPWMLHAA